VFAHRGGSALGPENTIPAFDRGLAAGADGLELDVHLSRDGVVVVHHDRLLDRTTTAAGPVRARSAAELAAIDATSKFDPTEPRAGVPTLADVLRRYADIGVIIELKEADPRLATAVIDEVKRAGALERVCLGSFSWQALRAARRYEPAVATSAARFEVRLALYASWVNLHLGRRAFEAFQVPETSGSTRVVSPRFVRIAHRAGLVVQVWTVDDPDDVRRLLEWGVDAIISDRPDVAADVVRKWARRP
jgi:glycerophosphoryl diester phosphodiesterase